MVRISGDEAFILATIEVVKVLFISLIISILRALDNVWCMYSLRRYGQVTMYVNDIENLFLKAFRKLWSFLISCGRKTNNLEIDKFAASKRQTRQHGFSKHGSSEGKSLLPVRTILLLIGLLVSLFDIFALFALSTEGKEVADKPEFGIRSTEAIEIPNGSGMEWYNPHDTQIRYKYVIRRLGKRMIFTNGTEFSIEIPRKLDVLQDEKWPFNVPLEAKDKYATVHTKDFVSQEKANFSQSATQVTGLTESGKRLRHYNMAQRDKIRNACSGSIGAGFVDGINGSATFCYTDELRDMSCENKNDGEPVSFSMKCSEIRVERFGDHRHNFTDGDSSWWLTRYANFSLGVGSQGLMQMVSLRGYKRHQVSPSAMIVAAVLTEFPSQGILVRRPFVVDVGVIVVPNWLVASSVAALAVVLSLGAYASAYVALKNLVILTNWQELFIANLLNPLDCLNRANKKKFRCVVAQGGDKTRKYLLHVEPGEGTIPVSWVKRKDIATLEDLSEG